MSSPLRQTQLRWAVCSSIVRRYPEFDSPRNTVKYIENTIRAAALLAVEPNKFDIYAAGIVNGNMRHILRRLWAERNWENKFYTRVFDNFIDVYGHDFVLHALRAAGGVE